MRQGANDKEKAAGSRRILVVEDNEDSQHMLCELLNLLGHRAEGISTAAEPSA